MPEVSGRDGYFASGVRVTFSPIHDWRRLFFSILSIRDI